MLDIAGITSKTRMTCTSKEDNTDADSDTKAAARRETEAQVESVEGAGYYYFHSALLLGSRLLNRALNWYTGLLHLAPKDKTKIYRALSLHHLKRGALQKALVFLKEWSRHDRSNPEPIFKRGEALASLGEYRRALASFDKVLGMQPDHIPALTRKCSLLLRLKNYSEAIEGLELLTQEQPQEAKTFYLLGLAYDGDGQLDKAIGAMQEAVKLDPEEIKYHQHLGFMNVRKEEHGSAAEHFSKALELENIEMEAGNE